MQQTTIEAGEAKQASRNYSTKLDIGKETKTQPLFQPRHLATVAPAGEQVNVSLSNAATWRKFNRQNTEMIVTKVGRRMFPSLSLEIAGLDPVKKYEVYVSLMLADPHTLKYQRGVWLANGLGETYPPPGCNAGLTYVHPDSPAPGRHWTSQEVTFMRLKLTNKLDGFAAEPSRNGTMIFAYSMHKYLPVVHIREVVKNNAGGFYTALTFPGTEFITVTAYQNPELTDLKIQFNPYAKGIRNQGDRSSPLLIDSFRPTVQALRMQQQLKSESEQRGKEPQTAAQSDSDSSHPRPASIEFGSYPNQAELSYGRWTSNETAASASATHRHRPYSVDSGAKLSTASPPQHEQLDSYSSQLASNEFGQQLCYYNPYSWYLPPDASQQQQDQQQAYYYYQQYQQAYQAQQSAQMYYSNYYQYYPPQHQLPEQLPEQLSIEPTQQQQQQQQQQLEEQRSQLTPQPQAGQQCSTMLHNVTDSSPSGLSFEQAE